jgi:hypothetical protein
LSLYQRSTSKRTLVTANAQKGVIVTKDVQAGKNKKKKKKFKTFFFFLKGWQISSIEYDRKAKEIIGITYQESSNNYFYSNIYPNGEITPKSKAIPFNTDSVFIGVSAYNPFPGLFTCIFLDPVSLVWSVWTIEANGTVLYNPTFDKGGVPVSEIVYVY